MFRYSHRGQTAIQIGQEMFIAEDPKHITARERRLSLRDLDTFDRDRLTLLRILVKRSGRSLLRYHFLKSTTMERHDPCESCPEVNHQFIRTLPILLQRITGIELLRPLLPWRRRSKGERGEEQSRAASPSPATRSRPWRGRRNWRGRWTEPLHARFLARFPAESFHV